ncbi:MAG: phage terminase large subunit [Planctomycetota bacterium]
MFSQPIARVARRLRDAVDTAFAGRPAEPMPGDRAEGLLAWGQRLLPQHFAKPPSAMHRWLADRLDEVPASGGAKINLLGPRGAAKSTIGTLACVLRSTLEGAEPYVWIVSDTKDQAQSHLENVKTELLENERLAAEYPRGVGRGPRWTATGIELRNGAVVEAYGTGQRVRGRRRRWRRPTLIVCDDIENEVQAASTRQRATSSDWFHGTLLKAGTRRTNLVNLATALHRDALAMRLHRTAGWRSRVFRSVVSWPTNIDLWDRWEAIYCDRDRQNTQADARRFYEANRFEMDAGAEVLWPEEEDLYTLMKMRVESGRPAFEREKQNSPIDPERCEWPEEYFDEAIWFDEWPERLAMKTIALDPSKGRDAQHGDYSAIVLMGVDDDGRLYVEADLERRPTPRMVADAVRWCRKHKPDAFGVEANQWQQLLAGEFVAEFARQGLLGVSPSELHNYTQKEMRIRRLGPYLSQRRLRFRRGSPGTELLVEQLRDFPIGSHDDGPDALEMALRLAEELWRRG